MSGTATRKLAERLQAEERGATEVLEIFVWSARRVLQGDVEHQVVDFLESESRRDDDNDLFATLVADFVVGGFSRRTLSAGTPRPTIIWYAILW
jgi:hypothetical protein